MLRIALAAVFILLTGCGSTSTRPDEQPLRVGTSKGHPPFSEKISRDIFVGVDVDLALSLGESLGRPVEFVGIEWPSLLSDLVEERFDVAVGGIHVTPTRTSAATFSTPYFEVEHAALVRCVDVGNFVRIEDVNRVGVRVLVPRGTAGEELARRYTPDASILYMETPRHAYEELADGTGELVLTNGPLADVIARRDPHLCVGLSGATLGSSPVAMLAKRDSPLLPQIERWIGAQRREDLFNRALDAHSIRLASPAR